MATKKKPQVLNLGKLSATTRAQIKPSKREEMPSSAFLKPGEKKYPVKKKDAQGNLQYDPNLLLAAERRARIQGETGLANKAKSIRTRVTGTSGIKPKKKK